MQLHELKPVHKLKKRKRVGRGGKRGAFSGRGQKGQKSRSGKRLKPMIRELIKRYPKLRGYKFRKRAAKTVTLDCQLLEKKFEKKSVINPKILLERELIRRIKGEIPVIKILARGELKKALIIEGCQVSKLAKEKIEKAGGKIEADRSASRGLQRGKMRKIYPRKSA